MERTGQINIHNFSKLKMKDNTKEKALKRPTKEELLKFETFYKNDTNGYPIYQYYDSFYGVVGNVVLKLRMK